MALRPKKLDIRFSPGHIVVRERNTLRYLITYWLFGLFLLGFFGVPAPDRKAAVSGFVAAFAMFCFMTKPFHIELAADAHTECWSFRRLLFAFIPVSRQEWPLDNWKLVSTSRPTVTSTRKGTKGIGYLSFLLPFPLSMLATLGVPNDQVVTHYFHDLVIVPTPGTPGKARYVTTVKTRREADCVLEAFASL